MMALMHKTIFLKWLKLTVRISMLVRAYFLMTLFDSAVISNATV